VSEPVNLAYLCHHYGEAYEINMRRRRYETRRRDDGTVLTADSADALLDLIRADYSARPVLRQVTGDDPRRRRPAGYCPGGNGGAREAALPWLQRQVTPGWPDGQRQRCKIRAAQRGPNHGSSIGRGHAGR